MDCEQTVDYIAIRCKIADFVCFYNSMPDARSSNYNGRSQGGSNADNVLADAYVKGVRGKVNWQDGYAAMRTDAEVVPPNSESFKSTLRWSSYLPSRSRSYRSRFFHEGRPWRSTGLEEIWVHHAKIRASCISSCRIRRQRLQPDASRQRPGLSRGLSEVHEPLSQLAKSLESQASFIELHRLRDAEIREWLVRLSLRSGDMWRLLLARSVL